jgi:hypothetical protein
MKTIRSEIIKLIDIKGEKQEETGLNNENFQTSSHYDVDEKG